MNHVSHPSGITRGVLLGFGIAVAAWVTAGVAAAGVVDRTPKPTGQGDIEIVRGGLVVSIDPATGRMRPLSQDDARDLIDDLLPRGRRTPPEDWQITHHADGMVSARLPQDYVEYSVLRVLPDGSLVTDCVQGPEAAATLLNADLASPSRHAPAAPPAVASKPAGPAPAATLTPTKTKAARKAAKRAPASTAGGRP